MSGTSCLRAGLVGISLLTGCAGHSAPPGFLPDTEAAQQEAYGGWLEVNYRSGSETRRVVGELIAISDDSIWVKDASGGTVIDVNTVVEGQLVGYDSQANQVGGAVAVGVVSTLSNGFFLVFTAPMWAIGGAIAASHQSRLPINELPATGWNELARFARFPQGMPSGVVLSALRAKGS